MEEYTKKQVSEIIGLPFRSIQYYTERDLVVPEIELGEGSGHMRRYSKKNLVEFGIIKALTGYGMTFFTIKQIMWLIRMPTPNWKSKDAKGFYTQIDMRGFLGVWEKWPENSYLILYKFGDKDLEFIPMIGIGDKAEDLLDAEWMVGMDVESVLIINLYKIVNKINRA